MSHEVPQCDPISAIPDTLARDIVAAIHAVADEIRVGNGRKKRVTNNKDGGEFWDILNTNVYTALNHPNCMATVGRTGFWRFILAFYRPHGVVLSFMREQRFKVLQTDLKAHGHITYTGQLSQLLNQQLSAPAEQLTLFPSPYGVDLAPSVKMQKLLWTFQTKGDAIGNHVIVLFDSDRSGELHHVRAVLVDPYLDIVNETDWSRFIPVQETVIAEKVIDATEPANTPSRGLTLTAKALARKKDRESASASVDPTKVQLSE